MRHEWPELEMSIASVTICSLLCGELDWLSQISGLSGHCAWRRWKWKFMKLKHSVTMNASSRWEKKREKSNFSVSKTAAMKKKSWKNQIKCVLKYFTNITSCRVRVRCCCVWGEKRVSKSFHRFSRRLCWLFFPNENLWSTTSGGEKKKWVEVKIIAQTSSSEQAKKSFGEKFWFWQCRAAQHVQCRMTYKSWWFATHADSDIRRVPHSVH